MAPQGLRSHLSGSVPISIAVHVVVLLVLVVIPLVDIVLPMPAAMMPSYVMAAPLPPPPPAPAPHPVQPVARSESSEAAPVRAPDRIAPDAPSPPAVVPNGTIDGIPDGLGADGLFGPPAVPVVVPLPDPPRPQTGPIRAAQLPELPRKTVDVRPLYPEVARSARVEGTVIIEAVLDTTGRITQLRVIKSVPLLDQAALDAVRQWRYTPSMYGGRPVSVLMTITVRFTLQQ
jgi:protein TonB